MWSHGVEVDRNRFVGKFPLVIRSTFFCKCRGFFAADGGTPAPGSVPTDPNGSGGWRLVVAVAGGGTYRRISSRTVALTDSRNADIAVDPAEAPLDVGSPTSAGVGVVPSDAVVNVESLPPDIGKSSRTLGQSRNSGQTLLANSSHLLAVLRAARVPTAHAPHTSCNTGARPLTTLNCR